MIGGGLSGIVTAYELLKLGCARWSTRPTRSAGGCARSLRRAPAAWSPRWARCASRRPRPPSSPTSTCSGCAPPGSRTRWTSRRRARSSTSRARRTTPRTLDDLPPRSTTRSRWPGTRRWCAARRLEEMQDGDPRPGRQGHQGDLDELVEQLDEHDASTASWPPRRRSARSGTARCSARSASAPAAGTPTTRTRSWRSCGSSTPPRTTTTAASSAAASRCRCGLWQHAPERLAHWPAGTTLASLHPGGRPLPAVTRLHRTAPGNVTVTDAAGGIRTYRAAVFTAQSWMLLSRIACDEGLFPIDHWTAIERTHYMGSTKLFCLVDRPFWNDVDPQTGRRPDEHDAVGPDDPRHLPARPGRGKPGLICLSYTWADDSLKWLPLSAQERMDVMLASLREIYPDVDLRRHVIASPVTVSWETERDFMGAFKANLPGPVPLPAAAVHPLRAGRPAGAVPRPVPGRRRHLLDGGLGGGRGADGAQRGVGRGAPPRRRDRIRTTPALATCSPTSRRSGCPRTERLSRPAGGR